MIFLRVLTSLLAFLLLCVPCMIISVPVVAIMLRSHWNGRTTIFGNAKWGRGTDHFAYPTHGNYWEEFNWLVLRNPVNNLHSFTLAVRNITPVLYDGPNYDVGDKTQGGFYMLTMGLAWEMYWIKPYTIFGSRRCIRARIGWKIYEDNDELAAFVFAFNPFKSYLGV